MGTANEHALKKLCIIYNSEIDTPLIVVYLTPQ